MQDGWFDAPEHYQGIPIDELRGMPVRSHLLHMPKLMKAGVKMILIVIVFIVIRLTITRTAEK